MLIDTKELGPGQVVIIKEGDTYRIGRCHIIHRYYKGSYCGHSLPNLVDLDDLPPMFYVVEADKPYLDISSKDKLQILLSYINNRGKYEYIPSKALIGLVQAAGLETELLSKCRGNSPISFETYEYPVDKPTIGVDAYMYSSGDGVFFVFYKEWFTGQEDYNCDLDRYVQVWDEERYYDDHIYPFGTFPYLTADGDLIVSERPLRSMTDDEKTRAERLIN